MDSAGPTAGRREEVWHSGAPKTPARSPEAAPVSRPFSPFSSPFVPRERRSPSPERPAALMPARAGPALLVACEWCCGVRLSGENVLAKLAGDEYVINRCNHLCVRADDRASFVAHICERYRDCSPHRDPLAAFFASLCRWSNCPCPAPQLFCDLSAVGAETFQQALLEDAPSVPVWLFAPRCYSCVSLVRRGVGEANSSLHFEPLRVLAGGVSALSPGVPESSPAASRSPQVRASLRCADGSVCEWQDSDAESLESLLDRWQIQTELKLRPLLTLGMTSRLVNAAADPWRNANTIVEAFVV
jgi:hypothetical protein